MTVQLRAATIRKLWPRAKQGKIDAIARVAPTVFDRYGIECALDVAHLMAQISHENGAGTITRENLNYRTAEQLLKIFGAREFSRPCGGQGHSAKLTPDEARALIGRPRELAERVYGLGNPKKAKELGNTRPGDGYRMRGGGDLQLTGGHNYKHVGELTGFDLYDNPELLDDPATSFTVAVAEFVALNCLPAARADDCELVTRRVNGGRNGLAERTVWLRKWKAALAADAALDPEPAPQPAPAPVPLPRPDPRPDPEPAPIEVPDDLPEIPLPTEPRGGESDQGKPAGRSITTWSTITAILGAGWSWWQSLDPGVQIAVLVVAVAGLVILFERLRRSDIRLPAWFPDWLCKILGR